MLGTHFSQPGSDWFLGLAVSSLIKRPSLCFIPHNSTLFPIYCLAHVMDGAGGYHDTSPDVRLNGYLPIYDEAPPLALHSNGTLNSLIRSRSSTSLHRKKRPSSIFRNELIDEEAQHANGTASPVWRFHRDRGDGDDLAHERRASQVLNNPQMRSMRLIGNSNPRYNWKRYWKTEEELKQFKKPLFVLPSTQCLAGPRTTDVASSDLSGVLCAMNEIRYCVRSDFL